MPAAATGSAAPGATATETPSSVEQGPSTLNNLNGRSYTGVAGKLDFSDEQYDGTPDLKSSKWSKRDTRSLLALVAKLSPPDDRTQGVDWTAVSKTGTFGKRHGAQECQERYTNVSRTLCAMKGTQPPPATAPPLVDSPSAGAPPPSSAKAAGEPVAKAAPGADSLDAAKRQLNFASATPKASVGSARPTASSQKDRLKKGDTVSVQSRTWPGMNKPGGAGRVWKVNDDGTYDVKYLLGGTERRVQVAYITKKDLVSVAPDRKRRPRTIYDPDTMEAVVPGEKERREEEEREQRLRNKAERQQQRERERAERQKQEEEEARVRAAKKKKRENEKAIALAEQQARQLEKKRKAAEAKLAAAAKRKKKSPPSSSAGAVSRSNSSSAKNAKAPKVRGGKKNAPVKKKSGGKDSTEKKRSKELPKGESKKADGKGKASAAATVKKKRALNPQRAGLSVFSQPKKVATFQAAFKAPAALNVPKIVWPRLPGYLEDSRRHQADLVTAAALIALRSAETPAPFIRPASYPEGWEPASESSRFTEAFQGMVKTVKECALGAVRASGVGIKIDEETSVSPLEAMRSDRLARHLLKCRVEHDRLRLQFLEDVARVKHRFSGSAIAGANKLLAGRPGTEALLNNSMGDAEAASQRDNELRRIEQVYCCTKEELVSRQQTELNCAFSVQWLEDALRNPAFSAKLNVMISEGLVGRPQNSKESNAYGRGTIKINFPYQLKA